MQGFKQLPNNKQSNPNMSFSQKGNGRPDLLKAEGDKEVEGIIEMNQVRTVGPEHFSLQLCICWLARNEFSYLGSFEGVGRSFMFSTLGCRAKGGSPFSQTGKNSFVLKDCLVFAFVQAPLSW